VGIHETIRELCFVSINASRGLFSLFCLLTFEDGTDTLSQNTGKELTLYTV